MGIRRAGVKLEVGGRGKRAEGARAEGRRGQGQGQGQGGGGRGARGRGQGGKGAALVSLHSVRSCQEGIYG